MLRLQSCTKGLGLSRLVLQTFAFDELNVGPWTGMGQKDEARRPLLSGHQARAPTTPDSLPPPVDNLQPPDNPTTSLLHEAATPSAPMPSSLPQGYSEHVACYVPPAQEGQPQTIQIHRLGAKPESMACPRARYAAATLGTLTKRSADVVMEENVPIGSDRPAAPPLILKLAHIQALSTASPPSHGSTSLRIPYHQDGLGCLVSFSACQQPSDLLKRPTAIAAEALQGHLTSGAAQNAVRTAVEAYMQHHASHSSFPQLHPDPIGLSEGLAVLQVDARTSGMLLAMDSAQQEDFILPEGFTPSHDHPPATSLACGHPVPGGPHSPEASRHHATCISPSGRTPVGSTGTSTGLADLAEAASAYGHTSPSPMRRLSHAVERLEREDLRAAAAAGIGADPGAHGRDALARLLGLARAAPEPIFSHRGPSGRPSEAGAGLSFILIWAEAGEGELQMSPSLLLAYLLLASRRPNALFLRMATGFGFAQIGDYVSSLFFLFRRRGHRLKCWECGVKKKAPCGNTARPDLPWCCHRRLGEWMPQLSLRPSADGRSVCFREEDAFFLTLLPPKVAIEADEPITAQLSFRPPVAAVVSLSELLKERPEHVVSTLQKALSRLAPNCRLFWGSDPWIMHRVNQIVEGHGGAASDLHRWLERTAYHKVPRAHQEEAVEQLERPFDLLVDEVMPLVRGAPNLGGATRNDLAARQAATRARGAPPRRQLLGSSLSQEMEGQAVPSASDTSRQRPAASGDPSGGSPPEQMWQQTEPYGHMPGCFGHFRVPAGRLRADDIGRHAFRPFSEASQPKGPLRLNLPARESASQMHQDRGNDYLDTPQAPSLQQAEEMLARNPGAMMAAMAQVAAKMQKPNDRPSVTVVAHATTAHAVVVPDQPMSAHSMISQAMESRPTTAAAVSVQDSEALHAPAPSLTQSALQTRQARPQDTGQHSPTCSTLTEADEAADKGFDTGDHIDSPKKQQQSRADKAGSPRGQSRPIDIPCSHSATGTRLAEKPADTPSSSPERSRRSLQPMHSPTHSQPIRPIPSRSPAAAVPSAAARSLWTSALQHPLSSHPAGSPTLQANPLQQVGAQQQAHPEQVPKGRKLQESGHPQEDRRPLERLSSGASHLQQVGMEQQLQGPDTPDAAMGGAPTAGVFWAQLEAMCRSGLQAAAHHPQNVEEDREGMAMLQQASRLMKQVLLKGSPRSVSDADTAMFVDSGDDDSSQPRSHPSGCPQDVPTPTVSDEPSEIVHPSQSGHEQVVMSPIQGRRPLGASSRAPRRSRLGYSTQMDTNMHHHRPLTQTTADHSESMHLPRPHSATAHWVDANQSAQAALETTHPPLMEPQEETGYFPRSSGVSTHWQQQPAGFSGGSTHSTHLHHASQPAGIESGTEMYGLPSQVDPLQLLTAASELPHAFAAAKMASDMLHRGHRRIPSDSLSSQHLLQIADPRDGCSPTSGYPLDANPLNSPRHHPQQPYEPHCGSRLSHRQGSGPLHPREQHRPAGHDPDWQACDYEKGGHEEVGNGNGVQRPVRASRRTSPPAGPGDSHWEGRELAAEQRSPRKAERDQAAEPKIAGWRASGKRRRISHSLSLCTSSADVSEEPILPSPRCMPTHHANQGSWEMPFSPACMPSHQGPVQPEIPGLKRHSSGLLRASSGGLKSRGHSSPQTVGPGRQGACRPSNRGVVAKASGSSLQRKNSSPPAMQTVQKDQAIKPANSGNPLLDLLSAADIVESPRAGHAPIAATQCKRDADPSSHEGRHRRTPELASPFADEVEEGQIQPSYQAASEVARPVPRRARSSLTASLS
ncbi:hypothetical protein WJX74_006165 [Apatococcus lobatus]|uniref:Uncharacterized protein n=1 Tax=Apatococcus lobatus TaxID=904363 RepID=A0AAW1SAF8_9CHLO